MVTKKEQAKSQSRKGEHGQTSVLFALAFMVFICFLAFMVDIGQMIHDRILTQNVADMVALSAANAQAAGYNELADLNWEYEELQNDLVDVWLPGFIYANKSQIENLIQYFKDWMAIVKSLMMEANSIFPQYAEMAAYKTLDYYNGMYGGFSIDNFYQFPDGKLCELHHTDPVDLRGRYVEPAEEPPVMAFNSIKWRDRPIMPMPTVGIIAPHYDTLDEPYMLKEQKFPTYPTHVVVSVSRQPRKVFVNLPDYGYDVGIPKIEAWAAAMPTGGMVKGGETSYFARFIPLEAVGAGKMFKH